MSPAPDAGVDVLVAQGTEAGGHTGRGPRCRCSRRCSPDRPAGGRRGRHRDRGRDGGRPGRGAAGVWIGTPLLSCPGGPQLPGGPREGAASGDETVLTARSTSRRASPGPSVAGSRTRQRLQPRVARPGGRVTRRPAARQLVDRRAATGDPGQRAALRGRVRRTGHERAAGGRDRPRPGRRRRGGARAVRACWVDSAAVVGAAVGRWDGDPRVRLGPGRSRIWSSSSGAGHPRRRLRSTTKNGPRSHRGPERWRRPSGRRPGTAGRRAPVDLGLVQAHLDG